MSKIALRAVVASLIAAGAIFAAVTALAQQTNGYRRTADGLTIYLGVVPAVLASGRQAMHGGAPRGQHEYHVVAAIIDSATGRSVADAKVTANISGLGLGGYETTLEPMQIADTITYGAFVYLPGADLYTVRLAILRPDREHPTLVTFTYDHRRQ